MSRNYKFLNPQGLYFVSFAVIQWLNVFEKDEYKAIVVDSLNYCVDQKGMEITAWCLMTNHMHIIFRARDGIEPQNVLGDFKRFTSKALVSAIRDKPAENESEKFLGAFRNAAKASSNVNYYQFWRHDNKPIELWSNKVIRQKVIYVHENPVKGGLVSRAEDYPYSSARDYAGERGLVRDIVQVDLWSMI